MSDSPDRPPIDPVTFQEGLGTFWSDIFDGQNEILGIAAGEATLAIRTADVIEQAAAVLGRTTVPVFDRRVWWYFGIRQSDRGVGGIRYGSGRLYGGGATYGQASASAVYPTPDDLVRTAAICNRLTAPTVSLTPGVDFWFLPDTGEIEFLTDPFEDSRFSQLPIVEDGVEVDQEAALWLYRPEFDREWPYKHAGYIYGFKLETSQRYLNLVNAVGDAVSLGSSHGRFMKAIAAASEIPITFSDIETVEEVTEDSQGELVITDAAVYRVPTGSEPTVEVGDVLPQYSSVCDALRVYEFNRGGLPDWCTGLTLGPAQLGGKFPAGIGFENAEVPVTAREEDGKTRVRFRLAAKPDDAEAFWDLLEAREDSTGESLAIKMTGLPAPTIYEVPETINAARFVADNVLRLGGALVEVKARALTEGTAGLQAAVRTLPAHTRVILVVLMPSAADGPIGQPAEAIVTVAGMAETAETTPSVVNESIRLRPVVC